MLVPWHLLGTSASILDPLSASDAPIEANSQNLDHAMRTKLWTIEEWQGLFYTDLDEWARVYSERLAHLDMGARRSAITWTPELEKIQENAAAVAASKESALLAGVPYALKDLFDLANAPTTCGSRFYAQLAGTVEKNSEIVDRFQSAGAICTAKTTMNEFAYGLSGENLTYGNCQHPAFPKFMSGGSSSGSAWAVGAGLTPVGIGTDTGGSIRVPSAWCGLFGLRMIPGLWMDKGAFPLAPSFDTAGWMTAHASDLLRVCEALFPADDLEMSDIKGLWIEHMNQPIHPELQEPYYQASLRAGAEEDPSAADAFRAVCDGSSQAFSILQSTEAASVHHAWLEDYRVAYEPKVWGLINRGRHWREEQRHQADLKRQAILAHFEKLFETYDYVALPAVHQFAPYAMELTPELRDGLLALTSPASLAGLPAITVPVFDERRLSGGIQIVMPDMKLSRIRRILEAWK